MNERKEGSSFSYNYGRELKMKDTKQGKRHPRVLKVYVETFPRFRKIICVESNSSR